MFGQTFEICCRECHEKGLSCLHVMLLDSEQGWCTEEPVAAGWCAVRALCTRKQDKHLNIVNITFDFIRDVQWVLLGL